MRRYTKEDMEALTNWDGLLCKPPWKNTTEKCQYYARFVNRMLWRYFTPEDWKNIRDIGHALRVNEKLKRTTLFLAKRHLAR